MLKLIELHYLIKELNFYDDNIVQLIKYFYEFELEFISKFKSFISTFNLHNRNFYSYIYKYYKYKYCKIFLHNLNYGINNVCFHINIYYDDSNERKTLILRQNLNFHEIIEYMILYYKKYRKNYSVKNVVNDLNNYNFNKITNILLQQKNIYKQ